MPSQFRFARGWLDSILSRTVEIFMSFPPMVLAIVLVAVIGPGLGAVPDFPSRRGRGDLR